MKRFLRDVLNLPYYPGGYQYSEHEDMVENLLKKHKLKYLRNPNGSNQPPDFSVSYGGKEISLECKSSKGSSPTFNNSLPEKDTIYIFCSMKYDETTIFRGKDVVSLKVRVLMEEAISAIKKVEYKHRKILMENDTLNRGFRYYSRNMFLQEGVGKKDFFKHPHRYKCEKRVLSSFR